MLRERKRETVGKFSKVSAESRSVKGNTRGADNAHRQIRSAEKGTRPAATSRFSSLPTNFRRASRYRCWFFLFLLTHRVHIATHHERGTIAEILARFSRFGSGRILSGSPTDCSFVHSLIAVSVSREQIRTYGIIRQVAASDAKYRESGIK